MTSAAKPNVVVVGGGFAGLAAAVALHDRGADVRIIEARERLGGRTWTRPFADHGPAVEFGGAWFMPEHVRVRRELGRAGSAVSENLPTAWRWRTDGEIRSGLPVARDQWPRLEAALAQLKADARTVRDGAGEVSALSFAEYLRRLATTPAVEDFLLGWWAVTGGCEPSAGAAIDGLAAVADHGGILGVPETLRSSPALGWAAIAESMAARSQARIAFGRELVHVDHGDRIKLEFSRGGQIVAQAAVLALPINVLRQITFTPRLPDRLDSSFGKNSGRAIKVWLGTRGVPGRSLAAGRGRGLNLLLADREIDDMQLVVGFGPAAADFDPTDGRDLQAALAAFYPDAELIEFDSHDWNADPYARGTWATAPAHEIDVLSHSRFAPVGRLAFASSDFAPTSAGWIEGAMAAGETAAAAISGALDPTSVAPG